MNYQQEEEPMQTCVGNGFVLFTGGAQGTDQLAEDLGLRFGIRVEVLIPPGHSRSRTISPVSPDTTQLRNCPEGSHRVRFGPIGKQRQTSPRGNKVVRTVGFGSRQKSLSV